MTTRAKFVVTVVELTSAGRSIKALPVYSTAPNSENKTFTDATPSGELRISIAKPGVMEDFLPGREFYVDMTLCEAKA